MIHHGDLFDVLPTLEANSVDAVVTDPPYGLEFMGKDWDKLGATIESKADTPLWVDRKGADKGQPPFGGSGQRVRYGSSAASSQAWHERWAREVLRVLKPGGHLIAFGGTRTFHRLTCGLEDAGFEIRDCLSWLYGSGFPKSLDVSKAIDKAAGAERDVVGRDPYYSAGRKQTIGNGEKYGLGKSEDESAWITSPSTDAAKQWAGWGTALKPSWEPAILARKPLVGTVAANVERFGTGAINVDACRIGTDERTYSGMSNSANVGVFRDDAWTPKDIGNVTVVGRWPANVLLDEDAAEMLDAMSGESTSPDFVTRGGSRSQAFGMGRQESVACFGDSGGASRFFYTAKPSRAERDRGCWHLEPKSGGEATDREDGSAGVNSPRAGAGRTGGGRNVHPTVKPVELMRYLVRLITPPGGVVLDPFTGSGTTGMACAFEGVRFVGIEREAEYVEIARRRIADCVPLFGEPA